MSTFINRAISATRGLVEVLLMREPSRGDGPFFLTLSCLVFVISIWGLMVGVGSALWLSAAILGGVFLLNGLGTIAYNSNKVSSALLRLGAILLALVFLILVLTGALVAR
jgi:hypothetical protein